MLNRSSSLIGKGFQASERVPGIVSRPRFQVDSTGKLSDDLIAFWPLSEHIASSGDQGTDRMMSVPLIGSGSLAMITDGPRDRGTDYNGTSFMRSLSPNWLAEGNDGVSTGQMVSFWVSGWVRFDSLSSQAFIVSHHTATGNQRGWYVDYEPGGNEFRFVVYTSGTSSPITILTASTFGAPSTATWYHFIAYHDADDDEIGIAINGGTFDTTAHTGGIMSSSSEFDVGGIAASGSLDGQMADLGYWIGSKPSAQLKADLYNNGGGNALLAGA